MPRFEYKVVPAPSKGQKAKGVKTPEGRFALSIESRLNELAADGWEYLRAELLPSDERSGLTGTAVNWRNVLVFRRAVRSAAEKRPKPQVQPGEVQPAPFVSQPTAAQSQELKAETPHLSLVEESESIQDLDWDVEDDTDLAGADGAEDIDGNEPDDTRR